MIVSITPSKNFSGVLKLTDEWPARAVAARRFVMQQVGEAAHDELLWRIPSGRDYSDLWKSIRLLKVSGTDSSYLLCSKPVGKKVRKRDAMKTALFVEPRRGFLGRIPPEIHVLADYSPWTMDTLPFAPKSQVATIVYRKVSPEELDVVRKDRRRDRKEWEKKLNRVGIRIPRKTPIDLSSTRQVPDIASVSMNLEFGLGRESKPHWRPAMLSVSRGGSFGEAMKKAGVAMSDVKFNGWKKWPPAVDGSVGYGELKRYVPFQEKIGVI